MPGGFQGSWIPIALAEASLMAFQSRDLIREYCK
ncbi:hypothetical protein KR49_01150 [Synechococcus sp. KORDI-49]|nr:hypothetical protein KR49_01150 [Synechococcus sp. KORDI-49]